MNVKSLKLRSGEEIVCEVLEENTDKIKVFRPMLCKVTTSFDVLGRQIDVITLSDYSITSDDKTTEIPSDFVAFTKLPNENTQKLYKLESTKEFESNNSSKLITEENIDSKNKSNETMNFLEESMKLANFLEDLIDVQSSDEETKDWTPGEYLQPKKKNSRRKRKGKKFTLPPDMTDEKEMDRHMIMMQLYIPAESIMNLMTAGILDPEVLKNMIDEVKKRNRFTGDEKNREDFGNNYTDWNPDPNSQDY